MNYLSLVNEARSECRITGNPLTSFTGISAEDSRFLSWINKAWMDIQERRSDWDFLRSTFSFATVSQQQAYTPAQAGVIDLGNWKRDSLRIYQTNIGFNNEIYLPFSDFYGDFRDLYQFGAMRTVYQRPVVYSIDPAKNLLLGPAPNVTGYTVLGDYFKVASELSLVADIPSLPTQFHRAIVYRAMMFYGVSEAATEVYDEGKSEFKIMLANLEADQSPPADFGGPLA